MLPQHLCCLESLVDFELGGDNCLRSELHGDPPVSLSSRSRDSDRVLKVEASQKIVYGHPVMSRDALQNAGQRLDANRIVIRNDLVMLATDLGRDPDVGTALTDDLIP